MKSRNKQAPTMSDVARLAGVNRVTASVALRGVQAGTHVSEETRQRILNAARELGYTPNAMALALRRRRTDIIGCYIGFGYPNALDPFNAAVINGLQQGCLNHHKDLLLFGSFERDSLDEIYASLAGGKIDGLVMLPTPNNPIIERLAESHLPIIAIANPLESVPSVVVDDVGGSEMLAEHLVARGHRHILYRTTPNAHSSTYRRLNAFRQRANELDVNLTLTVAGDLEGWMSDHERTILSSPAGQRPTAVVCSEDMPAYRLLRQCHQLGLRVPNDLAIAGFDGIELHVPAAHRLTTIHAPWEEVTTRAVQLLIDLLDGRDVPAETVLPTRLVVGDTA